MKSTAELEWQFFFVFDGKSTYEKTGKFVQILIGNRQIIAIGEIEQFPYHANLVAALLERVKVQGGRWQIPPDQFAPPEGVTIVGGGWFKLTGLSCKLSGSSKAYGPFDRNWFKNSTLAGRVSGLQLSILD